MPSQILHTLFGEDVLAGIWRRIHPRFGITADKALEKIRKDYKNAFALGCQGPDIFYHSQMRRPVALEYGSLLHRRGYGAFTAALLKMALPDPPPDEEDIRAGRLEKGISALGAYALGFMTHAFLDRAAHPYIVYKSGWVSPAKPETLRYARAHAFFERLLDVLMLEELRQSPAAAWDQGSLLVRICEKPPLGLKELLARALIRAFPERAGKDGKLSRRIDNTFLDAVFFYRFTDPRKTALDKWPAPPRLRRRYLRGLAYIYPENFTRDIDYLNMEGRTWYYPSAAGGPDSRSFPQIYAQGVETAAESLSVFISHYLETGLFPITEAARHIGNGGLSIQDETGKPCAPSRSDPLPLDMVLEQQRRLREG